MLSYGASAYLIKLTYRKVGNLLTNVLVTHKARKMTKPYTYAYVRKANKCVMVPEVTMKTQSKSAYDRKVTVEGKILGFSIYFSS